MAASDLSRGAGPVARDIEQVVNALCFPLVVLAIYTHSRSCL